MSYEQHAFDIADDEILLDGISTNQDQAIAAVSESRTTRASLPLPLMSMTGRMLLAAWASFSFAFFFYPFQQLPAPTESVNYGLTVTGMVIAYIAIWLLINFRRGRKTGSTASIISTDSFKGFPIMLSLTIGLFVAVSVFEAAASGRIRAYLGMNLQEIVFFFALLCASFFAGDTAIRKLAQNLRVIERVFLSVTAGFGILALLTFGLGFMGGLYAWPARIMVAALAIPGAVRLFKLMRRTSKQIHTVDLPTTGDRAQACNLLQTGGPNINYEHCPTKSRNVLKNFGPANEHLQDKKRLTLPHPIAVIVGLFLGFAFAAASLPPWNYDSLLYHLAVPKFYMLSHRIYYIRDFMPANYPLNGEMLFLLSMLLKNDVVAQLVSYAVSCWLVLGVYLFSARFHSERTGVIAVSLLLSIYSFTRQLPINNNDTILALFSLAGAFSLVMWWQGNNGNDDNVVPIKTGNAVGDGQAHANGWLYLSGFFLGCAAGSKYSGFFILAAAGVVVAVLLLTRRNPKLLPGFCFAGAIGVIPWLGKNLLFTGNPFYPVFADLVGGRDWIPSATSLFTATIRNANLLSEGFWGYFAVPWRLTFREPSEMTIGPALLAFAPAFLVLLHSRIKANRITGISAAQIFIPLTLAAVYLTLWVTQLAHVARFALPGIVLLVPAVAAGVDSYLSSDNSSRKSQFEKICTRVSKITSPLISIMLIAGVITGLFLTVSGQFEAIRIANSPDRRELFVSNSGLYQISSYINSNIPANRKIAMLVDNRAFYLNHKNILMLNPLNNGRLDQVNIESPNKLLRLLKQENVDYVFVTDEVRRYTYSLPPDAPHRIYYPLVYNCDRLIKQGALKAVYKTGDFWLYGVAE